MLEHSLEQLHILVSRLVITVVNQFKVYKLIIFVLIAHVFRVGKLNKMLSEAMDLWNKFGPDNNLYV